MGWISCISVCVFFSKLFCCLSVCFLVFSPSLFHLLHLLSKHTYNNKITYKSFEKKHKKKYQPEPERYLFAVESRDGYPVFLFCFVFLEAFLLLFMFMFVCYMFSPCLFKFVHLQSENHI